MEIRRSLYNKEYIYTISDGKSAPIFYKNVRSLKEECVKYNSRLTSIKKEANSPVEVFLESHCYLLEEALYIYSIEWLNNHIDELVIACVSKNNTDWLEVIKKAPFFISVFSNPFSIISDRRVVTQNNKGEWGVLDFNNKEIVPFGKYSHIDGFKFKLAKVRKTTPVIFWETGEESSFDTYGIIDINGKEVIPCEYDIIYKFYGNDKWYTTLFKQGKHTKFHLGYRRTFGDFSDIEWYHYLEERGTIKWEG